MRTIAIVPIAAGLMLNPLLWSLVPHVEISPVGYLQSALLIASIYLISLGAYALLHPETTFHGLAAAQFKILVVAIAVELLLQVPYRTILAEENSRVDLRAHSIVYEGVDWAVDLWNEWDRVTYHWHPYLSFAPDNFEGRYLNYYREFGVSLRRTWNPADFGDTPPDTILVFGGSTVAGAGADDYGTIPSFLSMELNRDGPTYLVLNCGTSAYVRTQEIIKLVTMLREGCRPRIVVFYDGANDIVYSSEQDAVEAIHNEAAIRASVTYRPSPLGHIWMGLDGIFAELATVRGVTAAIELVGSSLVRDTGGQRASGGDPLLANEITSRLIRSHVFVGNLGKGYGFKTMSFFQPSQYLERRVVDGEPVLRDTVEDGTRRNIGYMAAALESSRVAGYYDLSGSLSDRTKPIYLDAVHISPEGNMIVAGEIAHRIRRVSVSDVR